MNILDVKLGKWNSHPTIRQYIKNPFGFFTIIFALSLIVNWISFYTQTHEIKTALIQGLYEYTKHITVAYIATIIIAPTLRFGWKIGIPSTIAILGIGFLLFKFYNGFPNFIKIVTLQKLQQKTWIVFAIYFAYINIPFMVHGELERQNRLRRNRNCDDSQQ